MVTIYALKDPRTLRIRYIGQTKYPKIRLAQHIRDARCRCHRTNWVSELKALGMSPEFETLVLVPDAEADYWEMRFLAQAKRLGVNLVNQTLGGGAPMRGKKHTPETKAVLSAQKIGRKHHFFGRKIPVTHRIRTQREKRKE